VLAHRGLIGCYETPSGSQLLPKHGARGRTRRQGAASMISGYRRNNGLGIVALGRRSPDKMAQERRAPWQQEPFEHDAGALRSASKLGYDARCG